MAPRVSRPSRGHGPPVTSDQAHALASELLVWAALLGGFGILLVFHLADGRRRRRRVVEICATGEFGPRAEAVRAIVARAGALEAAEAGRLVAARRLALAYDPRARRRRRCATGPPTGVRQRAATVVALGRGHRGEGRRARRARGPAGPGDQAHGCRVRGGDCRGRIVVRGPDPPDEVPRLTRAWREVVGPIGVRPRREP